MPKGVEFDDSSEPASEDQAYDEIEPSRRSGRLVSAGLVFLSLMLAAAAGLGAAAYNESRPAVYVSTATMIIDQEPALTASRDDGLISKLLRLRLKYVDIVQTTVFDDPLAASLGLPPGQVQSALSASAPPGSLLLSVSARTGSAARAERIAQGAAEALRDSLARQQESAGVGGADRVTLGIVSPARFGVKTAPRPSRSLLLGISIAASVLVLCGVVASASRRRRD